MARRFVHIQKPSFAEDRDRLGLTGRNFDYFFEKVEDAIDANPWFYGVEVPDGEGMMLFPTTPAFPDLPASYVYFKTDVKADPSEIHYYGLSPIWSQADVPPEDFS